ncbi:hypothetical protein [Tahibacter aquaticus]|uniref:hypothetical protein n=1 Tax=Tahibacter aquaticus TaxID=520092 RepID=UPI00105C3624|nr:hypothetical protein [Tahibacter aquaticus]
MEKVVVPDAYTRIARVRRHLRADVVEFRRYQLADLVGRLQMADDFCHQVFDARIRVDNMVEPQQRHAVDFGRYGRASCSSADGLAVQVVIVDAALHCASPGGLTGILGGRRCGFLARWLRGFRRATASGAGFHFNSPVFMGCIALHDKGQRDKICPVGIKIYAHWLSCQ